MKAAAVLALTWTLSLAARPALAQTDSLGQPAGAVGQSPAPVLPAAPATPEGAGAVSPSPPLGPAAPAATPALPPAIPPPGAVAKPSEDDIEVLDEVVDLQESEDPAVGWYGKGYPERVRILALPTARTTRKGGFELMIDHRSASPIYDSSSGSPWVNMGYNLVGLNGPMMVGLGLRYGILDRLDVGIYRTGGSLVDTYELDVRYQIVRQEDRGIDLAARVGGTWFEQRNVEDSSGFWGQLLATRLVANRLLLSAAALYHSNSTNATKYNQDTKYSAGAGAGVEVRLAAPVSLDAEMVFCVAGYCGKNPTFSGGVKFFTSRHTFALVCGNTQYITADGYLANTDTPWKDLVIGFNITREF